MGAWLLRCGRRAAIKAKPKAMRGKKTEEAERRQKLQTVAK